MSRYVVKSHRPGQMSIAIVILSAAIASITWFLLDRSHWSVIKDTIYENEQLNTLIDENRALENENQDLIEKNLMAEKLTAMDKQTASLLQVEIETLQEEIFKMKQELEFYQGIMAGTANTSGLSIQGLHIYPVSNHRTFLLNLVLTHVAKSVMVAEGLLSITFNGLQDNKRISFNLLDLVDTDTIDLSYKFRNFKKFEFEVILPKGFVPSELVVILDASDSKLDNIRKVFPWSVEY